jgi:hypothetical protein
MYSIEGFKRRDIDALFLRNSFSYMGLLLGLTVIYILIKSIQEFLRRFQIKNGILKFLISALQKLVKTFEFTVFIGIIETAIINFTVFSLL